MAVHTVAAGRAWKYSHNIGRNGAAGQGFTQPVSIALARDGVMYVANRGSDVQQSQRITKLTIDQQYIKEFGRAGPAYGDLTNEQLVFLTSVVVDDEGKVYASDEWKNQITVFDEDGNSLDRWGEAGDGEGQLNGPSGMALDGDGNLLIVNSLNSRVQKFTRDGQYLSGFGSKGDAPGQMDMPWGITVDNNGDIYVADWNNHRIQKFSPAGDLLQTFGRGGSGPGTLRHPTGVCVDGDGDVYVADWMNERIAIYNSDAMPIAYLKGDAVDVSAWGQMSLNANPDMGKRRAQVYNLEDQQRAFRMPVACVFDQETSRLIVADTQRARLQVYEKDKNYSNPQFNL